MRAPRATPGVSGDAPDLERVLVRLQADAERHVAGGPVAEDELVRLERALGRALPSSFRMLLERVGPGLFYQGHEIFGPLRVMVHDIELVPSLEAVLTRLRAERDVTGWLPFHRVEARLHLLQWDGGGERIVAAHDGAQYPDLAAFLRSVVLP